MFHLRLKPRPPRYVGRDTPDQLVDSSADVMNAGMFGVTNLVEPFDEIDGGQVFVAAVDVGYPLAGLPRIIEIEHRRDGVDPQAVEVVTIEPEERIAKQEVADLGAAVVEDLGAPVAMLAQPGVGMLVEMRAVEIAETV